MLLFLRKKLQSAPPLPSSNYLFELLQKKHPLSYILLPSPPKTEAKTIIFNKTHAFMPYLELDIPNRPFSYLLPLIIRYQHSPKLLSQPDNKINVEVSTAHAPILSSPFSLSQDKLFSTFKTLIRKKKEALYHYFNNFFGQPSKNKSDNPQTPPPSPATTTNAPPPGFDDLDLEETNALDVYYGDLYLGQFIATYTNDYLQFKDPNAIASKIPDIKDVSSVTKALSMKLSTNAEKVCTKKDTPSTPENACGYLEPDIAGVIFNWGLFQVKLFINPKYLKDVQRNIQFLPDSTGGLGYVTKFNGVATETSSNEGNSRHYTYSNDSVIGYKENNLVANSIFTSGEEDGSQTGYLKIAKATLNREFQGKLYQAGVLELPSNNILPSDEILGFGFSTSRNTVMNLQEFQATPLILFLNTMSNVQIYRNDQLIWSKVLPMGKQIIDTNGFPAGSYPLKIKMTDTNGQAIEKQQFFSKNSAFPSPNFPDFSVMAGIRKNYNDNEPRELFYKYDQQKLLNFSYAKGLKYPYGFRIDGLLIDNLRSYIESGLFYLTEKFNLSSGALVSNQHDYGFYVNSAYSVINFSNSFYLRKMLARDQRDNNIPNDYDPIAGSLLNMIDSVSYTFGKNNLGASVSFSQSQDAKTITSFGLNWSRILLHKQAFDLHAGVDTTYSKNASSIAFRLNCSFPHNKYHPTFSQLYKEQKSESHRLKGNTTTGGMRYQYQTEKYSTGFNLSGNKDIDSNSFQAAVDYDNRILATEAQVNYSKSESDPSPTLIYSLNFSTNVAYTLDGYGFNSTGTPLSGVIIKVRDKVNGRYKVLIDGSPNKIISSNTSNVIFLSPYTTYSISLISIDQQKNMGLKLYSPSNIITLYPGNMQVLAWEAHQRSIVVGQAVDENDHPIIGLNVTGGESSDTTVEEGYFQIDVFDSTKELLLTKADGEPVCKIELPTFDVNEDYILLKNLRCKSIQTKVKAKI